MAMEVGACGGLRARVQLYPVCVYICYMPLQLYWVVQLYFFTCTRYRLQHAGHLIASVAVPCTPDNLWPRARLCCLLTTPYWPGTQHSQLPDRCSILSYALSVSPMPPSSQFIDRYGYVHTVAGCSMSHAHVPWAWLPASAQSTNTRSLAQGTYYLKCSKQTTKVTSPLFQ